MTYIPTDAPAVSNLDSIICYECCQKLNKIIKFERQLKLLEDEMFTLIERLPRITSKLASKLYSTVLKACEGAKKSSSKDVLLVVQGHATTCRHTWREEFSSALGVIACSIIGASLSEPHTSESSGTSVTFTKIYEVLRINGRVCKRLHLKTNKTRLLTNASGHYTKNYNVSLQALHIRLVRTFIT